MRKRGFSIGALLLCLIMAAGMMSSCTGSVDHTASQSFSIEDIPAYSEDGYVVINDNIPEFPEEDFTTEAFESYSELDYLGRCGTAYANLGQELMPTEDRGDIGHVHPSGWHSVQYDNVEGGSLYNRSHLIGFQLAGENDNEYNLITGTRYMNAYVMLPFENMVADYIHETNNHVLYRVTPVYEGENLVASGVQMEAVSVEDGGEGICFNVYIYNVQPGIEIDYATGDSRAADTINVGGDTLDDGADSHHSDGHHSDSEIYVLNINSHKFHEPDCSSVSDMSGSNKQKYIGSRSDLIRQGYEPCGNCQP